MRLIDVDKLEADIEYWENHDDPKKPDYDTRDIEQVVGFQPTIDAIPISWLTNYIWGADTHEEKRALRKMFIRWEEEQCGR